MTANHLEIQDSLIALARRAIDCKGSGRVLWWRWRCAVSRERMPDGRFAANSKALGFWSRTSPSGECIIWNGYCQGRGYGRTWFDGKNRLAHHVAWFLRNGGWPEYLMHSCDTPGCVNVDHLTPGDGQRNVADMDAKNRRRPARGEAVNTAKLTSESVREIRMRHIGGESCESLARRFSLSRGAVWRLVTRRTWRHVE